MRKRLRELRRKLEHADSISSQTLRRELLHEAIVLVQELEAEAS